MRRYLANSVGLLDPAVAADFGFEQRILPILRGRGNGFKERVNALSKLLEDGGLARSATHIESALGHADLNFDAIDFFAY
jgi:hypothetical protein